MRSGSYQFLAISFWLPNFSFLEADRNCCKNTYTHTHTIECSSTIVDKLIGLLMILIHSAPNPSFIIKSIDK